MVFKHKKVMVVDDNEIDLYIAEKLMETSGFAEKVICVHSAKEALAYLDSQKASPEELPHFIFLDINMPEMSGFGFLHEYKKLAENIRKKCIIMMLTTSLDEDDRVLAENNEFVQKFLNKPLDRDKLAECL
jgi:CheY-like chemotaxis protein